MPVWIRGRFALARALPQASMSLGHGPRQRANHRPFDLLRDQLDGLEIARRRIGISRLDNVDLKPRQLPGQGHLVARSQARPGRLFAVSQCRVEHRYFGG